MDWLFGPDVFALPVPVAEKVVRTVAVYVFLIVFLRIAGKRELAQLNPFDLVVLLLLSNTVQNAIIGSDNSLTGGLLGATTLLLVNQFVVRFLFDHPKIDHLIEGESIVLIDDGRMLEDRMRSELLTPEELERAAHEQGFTSLDDVRRAVLEADGKMSFVGKEPSAEDVRFGEVLSRLDAIAADLAALRARTA